MSYTELAQGVVQIDGDVYVVGKERIADAFLYSIAHTGRLLHKGRVSGAVFLQEGKCSGRWAAPIGQKLVEGPNTLGVSSTPQVLPLPPGTSAVKIIGNATISVVVIEGGVTSGQVKVEVVRGAC